MSRLVIGTRGSALALKQTDIVAQALRTADPSVEVEVRVIQTQGDTNQQPIPLDTIGKGWFTKEIEQALLSHEIDLAVHSLKDMAEDMLEGLSMGAYLPREDARDVLISKHGESLEALKPGAIIGTDSARRCVQILGLRPDLRVESLRGNVPTRLEKLTTGNYDAIVLAAAGLKRLGLEEKITRYFSVDEMTPAPGQGTLAVQARTDNGALNDLLTRITDRDAAQVSRIERSFSATVGGGCKAPTGAYATHEGENCVLTAMIVGTDGRIIRDQVRVPWSKSDALGETLARKLLVARGV
jgi:hydroxymethylbilane synthase